MDAANFAMQTPHGSVFGYIADAGLARLECWDPASARPKPYVLHSAPNVVLGRSLREALDRYFGGAPEAFGGIPLALDGTEFQQRVWAAARALPWGQTETYGDLTRRLGLPPGSARAVGAALGANPVLILVPCHRFLGADGGLTGFAGGLNWKRALLELEGALLPIGN